MQTVKDQLRIAWASFLSQNTIHCSLTHSVDLRDKEPVLRPPWVSAHIKIFYSTKNSEGIFNMTQLI